MFVKHSEKVGSVHPYPAGRSGPVESSLVGIGLDTGQIILVFMYYLWLVLSLINRAAGE